MSFIHPVHKSAIKLIDHQNPWQTACRSRSNILSRNEAITLRAYLEPGSSIYNELQKALYLRQGIVHLSNGYKVNAISEHDKLLGGGLALSGTREVFDILVTNLILLISPNQDYEVIGHSICMCLQTLIGFIQQAVDENELLDHQLANALINTERELSNALCQLDENKIQKNQIEARQIGSEQKKRELENKLREIQAQSNALESKKTEGERIRINGLLDLIPLVGVVTGLISQEYYRIIPLYSPLRGLISRVNGIVENCASELASIKKQQRLFTSQTAVISQEIEEQKREVDQVNSVISGCSSQIMKKDQVVTQLGRELTILRNYNLSLKMIINSCEFLKRDLCGTIQYFEMMGTSCERELHSSFAAFCIIQTSCSQYLEDQNCSSKSMVSMNLSERNQAASALFVASLLFHRKSLKSLTNGHFSELQESLNEVHGYVHKSYHQSTGNISSDPFFGRKVCDGTDMGLSNKNVIIEKAVVLSIIDQLMKHLRLRSEGTYQQAFETVFNLFETDMKNRIYAITYELLKQEPIHRDVYRLGEFSFLPAHGFSTSDSIRVKALELFKTELYEKLLDVE